MLSFSVVAAKRNVTAARERIVCWWLSGDSSQLTLQRQWWHKQCHSQHQCQHRQHLNQKLRLSIIRIFPLIKINLTGINSLIDCLGHKMPTAIAWAEPSFDNFGPFFFAFCVPVWENWEGCSIEYQHGLHQFLCPNVPWCPGCPRPRDASIACCVSWCTSRRRIIQCPRLCTTKRSGCTTEYQGCLCWCLCPPVSMVSRPHQLHCLWPD